MVGTKPANLGDMELLHFEEKAKRLIRLLEESVSLNRIKEAAQDAAESYRILNGRLKNGSTGDREKFIVLKEQFLEIENEAWVKFYRTSSVGPRGGLPI